MKNKKRVRCLLLFIICHNFGMLKHLSKKKRPVDTNKLAFSIVQESTGVNEPYPISHKNTAAVELGKLGGKKGGKARAANMTKKQRSEAARRAANARWKNHKNDGA